MCGHNSLVTTVNAALGGSKSKTESGGLPDDVNDVTKGAATFDQALANMNALLNWG